MRTNRISRKTAAVAAVLTLGTGAAAFAYWTTTGNGTGTATTGTSTNWAVTTDAATGGPLTPGGPSQNVALHVKNNNTGVQHLNSVVVTVANSDGSAWTAVPGCSAADYAVSATTFSAGDVASAATVDGSVTVSMNNLASNQDNCKGATVPLYVAAS